MTNPNLNLDKNQNDVVDSSLGFGLSFGILMVIFIGMMVVEYFVK
ncbi:YqzM family protein [Aneurinibacillus migulanus]|uniref:YqzM-like protein n=1 Tax=Aneurinibacillus migulanus TaxID=47500 RepID=A0A1G8QL63_ANEMI|nr:YqzM family protein [Aneurinibacillus migulanus]MCP1355943.1 YqzM family protein [Aneurinibacillus migulanus]MED0892165.1 YqzM family protein [Aneurinibacillus migulanus]MED1618774.1 YqzM family protein [Aneurinibacillus migulanus]MED4730453.1 YqzM family protein [Aneurinibacillus migulanus]SDJ05438.1 YqzM-like protein [Aneurinibacillus migulanus]